MASSNAQDFSDNAMFELFRAEVESHTQTLNEGLLALEKEPGQPKLLESLMRAAHSIKGAARIVGVEDGVRLSHVMEDCLVAAQNGQVTLNSEAIDSLLRGVDAIVRIASPDQAAPDAAVLERLLQEIASIRQGKPRGAKRPAPDAAPSPPEPPKPATPGITVVADGDRRTVCPAGNLDPVTADRLRLILVEQLDAGIGHFRLDLAEVRGVSVEGLALLAIFARTVREQSGQALLELVNVGQDAATLFRLTGLASVYRVEAIGS